MSSKGEKVEVMHRSAPPLEQQRAAAAKLHVLLAASGFGRSASNQSAAQLLATRIDVDETIRNLAGEANHGEAWVRFMKEQSQVPHETPIARLFDDHLEAAQALADELGKDITIDISGDSARIAPQVSRGLAEPVLHLIQNAIEHGIESAAERTSVGKSADGTVTLSVSTADGQLIIAVEDDGRGMSAAGKPHWTRQLDSETTDDTAIPTSWYLPVAAPDEGTGLGAVQRGVEALGGSLRVNSRVGRGTRFELRAPLDVSFEQCLIVRSGDRLYAISSPHVSGAFTFSGRSPESISAPTTKTVDKRSAPLISLATILGIPTPDCERNGLLIEVDDQVVALTMNAWQQEVDVVARPLESLLGAGQVVSGACLLDDGSLALMLDSRELIREALAQHAEMQRAAVASEPARRKRILVVEDSASTRSMMKQLLTTLGYEVHVASDGQQALDMLPQLNINLVLTDIEMPNMNGVELTDALRKDQAYRNLPIIVLSTQGSEKDRRRAAIAGADSYLVKTELSELGLIAAIQRYA